MATSGRVASGGHTDQRSLSCLRVRPTAGHLQVWYTALALRAAACITSGPARVTGRVAQCGALVLCRGALAKQQTSVMPARQLSIHVGVQARGWCCAQAALMSLSCMVCLFTWPGSPCSCAGKG